MAAYANGQGVIFQKITLEEATKQAQKEQKLIFMDVYTDWCGPCKWMDKEVFTNDTLAEFMNAHYINLKIDAEKEGVALSKRFEVVGFPTFIFLNDKGQLLQKEIGGRAAVDFLELAQQPLAPKKNLAYYQTLYEAGGRENQPPTPHPIQRPCTRTRSFYLGYQSTCSLPARTKRGGTSHSKRSCSTSQRAIPRNIRYLLGVYTRNRNFHVVAHTTYKQELA